MIATARPMAAERLSAALLLGVVVCVLAACGNDAGDAGADATSDTARGVELGETRIYRARLQL